MKIKLSDSLLATLLVVALTTNLHALSAAFTTTHEADGVALAGIQGLNQKRTEELSRRDAENAELKARLEKLEQLLEPRLNGGAK